jgi:hypothetical protein
MAITVTLYDIDEDAAWKWARDNCPSFGGWLVYNYTDNWLNLDDDQEWYVKYCVEFVNEQEALMFQLRWQGTNET